MMSCKLSPAPSLTPTVLHPQQFRSQCGCYTVSSLRFCPNGLVENEITKICRNSTGPRPGQVRIQVCLVTRDFSTCSARNSIMAPGKQMRARPMSQEEEEGARCIGVSGLASTSAHPICMCRQRQQRMQKLMLLMLPLLRTQSTRKVAATCQCQDNTVTWQHGAV